MARAHARTADCFGSVVVVVVGAGARVAGMGVASAGHSRARDGVFTLHLANFHPHDAPLRRYVMVAVAVWISPRMAEMRAWDGGIWKPWAGGAPRTVNTAALPWSSTSIRANGYFQPSLDWMETIRSWTMRRVAVTVEY